VGVAGPAAAGRTATRHGQAQVGSLGQQIGQDGSPVRWDSHVVGIHGDAKLTGVTLRDTTSASSPSLQSPLFVTFGHDPCNEPVIGVIELDHACYVLIVGRSNRTNVEGVFACGNIDDHLPPSHHRRRRWRLR
jgi:thioredoxin reductase